MDRLRLPEQARVALRVAGALCVAALLLTMSSRSEAQDVWVGRPTVGDYVQRDIGEVVKALQQVQQAGRVKAQWGAEIAAARKAFFATSGTPGQRQAAEKRFAELLLQKDNYLLMMALVTGMGGPSPAGGMSLDKAFAAISGGELDGGVAQSAQPSFDRWVAAMRASLGRLITLTEQTLAQAIVANAPLYEQYKVERDKAEFDAFKNRRALAAGYAPIKAAIDSGRNPDGSRKLIGKTIVDFNPRQHLRLGASADPANDRKLLGIAAASNGPGGPQILECVYGPASAKSSGPSWTLIYERYRFWYRAVPQWVDAMTAANIGALHFKGPDRDETHLRMALDACPESTHDAREIMTQYYTSRPAPAQTHAPSVEERRAKMEERRAQSAARASERSASAREKMCARSAARVEQVRQQAATAAPAQALRMQQQLQAVERNHARSCGQ